MAFVISYKNESALQLALQFPWASGSDVTDDVSYSGVDITDGFNTCGPAGLTLHAGFVTWFYSQHHLAGFFT